MRNRWLWTLALAGVLGGCGADGHTEEGASEPVVVGEPWTVRDTTVVEAFEAAGVARPVAEATLSTKLMGQVVDVDAREGDLVAAGRALVRIDASDLAAKRAQVEASIREAEAVVRDAETHAGRMRALYEEDAAPKAQLDAAETGLERARAKLSTARAAAAEVDAMARYAVVRAPFDGVVTRRFVDPGDFAAPGAPIMTVLDDSRLRIAATAAPDAVRGVGRGDTLEARIEGQPVHAVVEGVVPGASGALYTVNALVDNGGRRYLAGSAAILLLPQGERAAVVVPRSAVLRRGDLTGVRVKRDGGNDLRWVRLGRDLGETVEVLSGLRPGDVVLLPAGADGSAAVVSAGREG